MATHFRIAKTDENEAARIQTKKILKDPVPGKRAVLGELGNKVLKNAELGKGKDVVVLKVSESNFKHVKARVDTHWKKTDVEKNHPSKPVTRSDSLKALNGIGVNAGGKQPTTNLKPKLVHLIKGAEVKKVKIINLKREESRLTGRSLAKLKQFRKNSDSSSIASSEETNDEDCMPQENLNSPDTHSHKLLEGIENIDINDSGNPILVSEYVNDIYDYLNNLEDTYAIRENFLDGHKQINHKMRTILVDWINEVHYQFKLEIDTYLMTVSIIDRYLQLVPETLKKELQLVGVTAMFIASKYEELYPPEIGDFAYITDDTYKKKQILDMEKQILKVLGFHLGKPLPTHFLRRFSKAAKSTDKNHRVAKYLIELSSVDYTTAHYKPSEIAAAALYISLYLYPLTSCDEIGLLWTNTLKHYTRYTLEHISPIIQRVAKVVNNAPNLKVQAVRSKHQSSKFERIAVEIDAQSAALEKLIEGHILP